MIRFNENSWVGRLLKSMIKIDCVNPPEYKDDETLVDDWDPALEADTTAFEIMTKDVTSRTFMVCSRCHARNHIKSGPYAGQCVRCDLHII